MSTLLHEGNNSSSTVQYGYNFYGNLIDENCCYPIIAGQDNTYHRNSLEEFFEERLLSIFHFRLPFLSGFSSSHLSKGEQ